MTKRAHISRTKRRDLFVAKAGKCHLCGGLVQPTEAWDVSHVIPLELGGADDPSNWDVAHRKCHRTHTAKTDMPAIAQAKRREASHRGFKAAPVAKIRSAPFRKTERSASRMPKPSLPYRPMFVKEAP